MALIRLKPEQVNEYWPMLEPGIRVAVPPTTRQCAETMNNILAMALRGEMRVWMITENYNADRNQNKLYGHMTTTVDQDWATKVRNLVVYSLYSWGLIPEHVWEEGAELLKKYARGLNCARIIALTNEQRVVEMVQRAGGRCDYKFVEIDL